MMQLKITALLSPELCVSHGLPYDRLHSYEVFALLARYSMWRERKKT